MLDAKQSPWQQAGFTLIELMVTLSVGAILIAVAVPSFTSMLANNRMIAQANGLVLSLNMARSEAIKQDVPAGVAVTAVGGAWTQGWTVCCTAGTALPIQSQGAVGSTLAVKAIAAGVGVGAVTFDSNGAQLGGTGTVIFTFCDSRGRASARDVEVDMAGRIQSGATAGFQADQKTALVCP
jgi:type IV fimbrial biogenesis protein FimT